VDLVTYVSTKLHEGGTDDNVSAADIQELLLKHRLFDIDGICRFIGNRSDVSADSDTSLVTVTMRDIYGTYQNYAGTPDIPLHPNGRYFTADDVEYYESDSPQTVTFNPVAFTLDFETAFSSSKTVKAIGHVVNIEGGYGVMYEAIGLLVGWASKMVNVRGQEFKDLMKHLKSWQALYATGESYGGWRGRG
jgi:hypothetical protein